MIHVLKKADRFLIQYINYCYNKINLDYNHIVKLVDGFVKVINDINTLNIDFYSDYRGYTGYKTEYKNKTTKSQWLIFYFKKDNDYWVYDILSSYQNLPPKIELKVKSKMRELI